MMTPRLLRFRPFVQLLLLCLLSVRARSESCEHAAQVFDDLRVVDANGASVRPTGHIYEQLSSENVDDVCRLDSTCCSREAERSLQLLAVSQYEDQTTELLSERLYTCYNSSITGALQRYLQEQKDTLVAAMLSAYRESFRPYVNLFDGFYAYLQQTVVTRDACDLPEQFNRVFFELFLAAYVANPLSGGPSTLPDTDAFRQCFYEYFLELYDDEVYGYYYGFSRSFNRTLLYLRALKTADSVIESILAHKMAPTCRDSLMKMTFCAQCAGYRSPQPCKNLCLNTMRGCLVELSNFAGEFERFTDALVRMKDSLESDLYNPWNHISLLQVDFFRMISDVLSRVPTIRQGLSLRCDAQGSINSNTKRQAFGGIVPRATIEPPTTELNQSAHCYSEMLSIFTNLPDLVCEEEGFTRNENCWNGRGVGSYGRSVTGFWWEAQRDNPEVLVCPRRRDVYREEVALLQYMTRELDILTGHYVCNPDDEDCSMTVESMCSYQVPMINVDNFEFSGERFAVSGDGVGSAPDPCEMDELSSTTPTTIVSTPPPRPITTDTPTPPGVTTPTTTPPTGPITTDTPTPPGVTTETTTPPTGPVTTDTPTPSGVTTPTTIVSTPPPRPVTTDTPTPSTVTTETTTASTEPTTVTTETTTVTTEPTTVTTETTTVTETTAPPTTDTEPTSQFAGSVISQASIHVVAVLTLLALALSLLQ